MCVCVCVCVSEGAPKMFDRSAGERQVTFSWSPPLLSQQNGVTTNYTLSCSPSPSSLPLTTSRAGSFTVGGFIPNTSYSCSIVAHTGLGFGPPSYISFTTLEDCKILIVLSGLYRQIYSGTDSYFQLLLSQVHSCLNFSVSSPVFNTVTCIQCHA